MIDLKVDGNGRPVSRDAVIKEWRIDTLKVLLYTEYDTHNELE
jgi:hypothetical protein